MTGRPTHLTMPPTGYADWLAELKGRIHNAQQRATLAVNRELVLLYWQIGRDILTRQAEQKRHVLHLLYGAPQIRGKGVPSGDGVRVMEMIEDIPAIGPVTSRLRLPKAPKRVYDALTGAPVEWTTTGDGRIEIRIPGLRIHTALVLEEA